MSRLFIYMKIEKIMETWARASIPNWSSILSLLMIYFEDKSSDWKKLVSYLSGDNIDNLHNFYTFREQTE